jgi:hypothetical protein
VSSAARSFILVSALWSSAGYDNAAFRGNYDPYLDNEMHYIQRPKCNPAIRSMSTRIGLWSNLLPCNCACNSGTSRTVSASYYLAYRSFTVQRKAFRGIGPIRSAPAERSSVIPQIFRLLAQN